MTLTLPADAPAAPDAAEVEALLVELAELIAAGGWERFVAVPVEPGERAFPDPWQPSTDGVALLLRRLAWHAGVELSFRIEGTPVEASPRMRRPVTEVEIAGVAADGVRVRMHSLGADDVVGTLAHEVGVAWALDQRRRASAPYRTGVAGVLPPGDDDARRGSIAAVYLGLGILAAGAAYQQYTGGSYRHVYAPLEYDVIQAGYVPLATLAFLLAVQAEVRGDGAAVALTGPAADEVRAWLRAIAGQRDALRARLGIPADAGGPARPSPASFAAEPLAPAPRRAEGKRVYRVRAHRTGLGFLTGTLATSGASVAMHLTGPAAGAVVVLGALGGIALGYQVLIARCSECVERVPRDATQCPRCGGLFAGDINHPRDRLDDDADPDEPAA